MNSPLPFEFGSIHERFLRSHFCRGKRRIQACPDERFSFRYTFAQKDGEAPDESVAGAGRVDRLNFKGRN